MGFSLSTDVAAPQDRFALWSSWGSGIFAPMRHRAVAATMATGGSFWGRILARELGPVGVTRVSAAGHEVVRGQRQIAAGDPGMLWLSLQLAGRSTVVRGDRQAQLVPGDLVLYDSSNPYLIHSPGPMAMAVFQVPRTVLDPPRRTLGSIAGLRIPAGGPSGGLAVPFLTGLANGLRDDELAPGDEQLGEVVLDLVRVVVGGAPAPGAPARPGAPLLPLVKRQIVRDLGDPELTPGAIARRHNISLRYLYKLFAEEEQTLGAWIRAQRLERCRRDLRDPALAEDSVASIASRWGFRSAAHFSRVFREAFGCSPSAYRAAGRRGPVGA